MELLLLKFELLEDGVVTETAPCMLVKSESSRVLKLLQPVSNIDVVVISVFIVVLADVFTMSSERNGTHTHDEVVRLLSYRGLVILGHVPASRVTIPLETLNVAVHITHWFYNATLSMLWLSKLSKLSRQCPSLVIRLLHPRLPLANVRHPLHINVNV